MVFRGQILEQVVMVAFDEDNQLLLHHLKDKVLHFTGFSATVEQISEDDEFVRLRIIEIA